VFQLREAGLCKNLKAIGDGIDISTGKSAFDEYSYRIELN
jgi:hypothetical protein